MAPHSLKTILQAPQWPSSLCELVTWCLMWDPASRPTSAQALQHEYFADAYDPWRPKSSRAVSRKKSDVATSVKESIESGQSLSSRTSSWFRKSMVARESAPAVPKAVPAGIQEPQRPVPDLIPTSEQTLKPRPHANKRATWANGLQMANGAPMPILPSIRPVTPLSNTVHAQAQPNQAEHENTSGKKIGRQLSVASNGNHYADVHREETERTLNGGNEGLAWLPQSGQRESFFSHLRKRARRLSARHQAPLSPTSPDWETNAGCVPWSNRQSMIVDSPTHAAGLPPAALPVQQADFTELDKALQGVKSALDTTQLSTKQSTGKLVNGPLSKKNQPSTNIQVAEPMKEASQGPVSLTLPSNDVNYKYGNVTNITATPQTQTSVRTRRPVPKQPQPSQRYETPDEEDELLNEVLVSAEEVATQLGRNPSHEVDTRAYSTPRQISDLPVKAVDEKASYNYHYQQHQQQQSQRQQLYQRQSAYLTPVSSANRENAIFADGSHNRSPKPVSNQKGPDSLGSKKQFVTLGTENHAPKWSSTPPYDESDWAAAAAASIFAVEAAYR